MQFLLLLLCYVILGIEGRLSNSQVPHKETLLSSDSAELFTTGFKNALHSLRKNSSLCDRIHPDDIPSECSCRDPGKYSLVIKCLKTFNSTYFNDTIGMKIDVDPCNSEGSKMSIDVTEKDHNIDYPITGIRAGESENIPIPGLSFIVPTIGHVGIDAAILIFGNPDKLTLKVGLNACVELTTHQICADKIPFVSKVLPWYVLSGSYSFGDICESNSSATKAIGENIGTESNRERLVKRKRQFQLQTDVVE